MPRIVWLDSGEAPPEQDWVLVEQNAEGKYVARGSGSSPPVVFHAHTAEAELRLALDIAVHWAELYGTPTVYARRPAERASGGYRTQAGHASESLLADAD